MATPPQPPDDETTELSFDELDMEELPNTGEIVLPEAMESTAPTAPPPPPDREIPVPSVGMPPPPGRGLESPAKRASPTRRAASSTRPRTTARGEVSFPRPAATSAPRPGLRAPARGEVSSPRPAVTARDAPNMVSHTEAGMVTRVHSAAEAEAAAVPLTPAERLRNLVQGQLTSADPERQARLHYTLGRLYEGPLSDVEQAAVHYRATYERAPDHVSAIRGARRVLETLGRYEELLPLFDAEVAATREPAARGRLLYDKGVVLERRLLRPPDALKAYQAALAQDPGNVLTLKAIERGHREAESWPALGETLDQLIAAVENPSLRAAYMAMRARLSEERLGDPRDAAARYETALATDPHASDALAHVKRLAANHGQWPQLVAALEKEHQLSSDADARREILGALARVQERWLQDTEGAAGALDRALATHPDDPDLLRERARIYKNAGRKREEAASLAALIERVREPQQLAELCHRVGRIHEEDLADVDTAIAWYRRALTSVPSDRAASTSLARVLEGRQDWEGLLAVLRGRAESITNPAERGALHHRIGRLLEHRLGRSVEAIDEYVRVLSFDPPHHQAFLDLTRLLAASGRWHELVQYYRRAIDSAAHDAEAIAWCFRLGGVLEDQLNDPTAALAAYERILTRDPVHLGALHAVQRAAERAGAFPRVVEALRAEASLASDEERRNMLLHRAAVITLEQLGDPNGAARSLESILESSPVHRESIVTLSEIRATAGQWPRAVTMLERLLPLMATPEEQARLLRRIATVHAEELSDDAQAIEACRRSLSCDPEDEVTHDLLERALERTGRWEELATEWQAGLSRAPDAMAVARKATALGALYEERLGDEQRALGAYAQAVMVHPLHRPALDARERLLTKAQDREALRAASEAEYAASTDPYPKAQAAFRTALIYAGDGGPPATSLDAFRPVFGLRPEHIGALLAVEDVYTRAHDDAGLAATYERLAQVVKDPRAQTAALFSLAEAQARTGTDPSDVHRQILRHHADDPVALRELVKAAEASGDTRALIATHGRLAAISTDPSVVAYHHGKVGEILLDSGDGNGALAAYRAALGCDQQSVIAARGFTRAACLAEDAAAMQEAARYEQYVTGDRVRSVEVLLDAARVHFRADNEAAAAVAYEEALSLDPDNPEAAAGLMATMMQRAQIPRLIELLTAAAQAATDPSRTAVMHLCAALFHAQLQVDFGAAIAATQLALKARPDNENAHEHLATYLERNRQWDEAAAALETWITKASPRGQIAAHLSLARIAEDQLDDKARAMQNLREVLARDENHAEALTSLVRLERLAGRNDAAVELVRRLFEVIEDDEQKAAALSEMAELEKARGNLPAAAEAAWSAIEVQGPLGAAARFYRGLVVQTPEHASWDRYRMALMSYLPRAKRQGLDWAATYRELARVFEEDSSRPDASIPALQEGSEACPDDASISLALVRALRMVRENERAVRELRRLIAVDVNEVGAWRTLAEILRERGEPDATSGVFAPLVILGQATEEEARLEQARPKRPGAVPPGILGAGGLAQLVKGGALDDAQASFIPQLAEVITKLDGIDYERWGISKRDRVRAGEQHALRAFADQIARAFGVPEFDLFVVRSPVLKRTMVVSGSPPALLVPAAVEHESDSSVAFHLARPLALLSRHLHPLDHIDDVTLSKVLLAVVRQFVPSFSPDGYPDDDLDAEMRAVQKAIGFFSRSRIQEAAVAFGGSPRVTDFQSWTRQIRRMSTRAGLLVSGDLVKVVELLGEDLGPDNYATDLTRFWLTDTALRFRRAVAQGGG